MVGNVSAAGVVLNTAGVNPVPFKLAVALSGVFAAPSVVLVANSIASLPPAIVGVKVTTTEQLPPAGSAVEQLEEAIEKSPDSDPESATFNPASATPPGLETVIANPVLVIPIPVPGKLSELGLRLSAAAATPVPETGTDTPATPTLVVATDTVPFWLPTAVGAKVTGAWHVPPAGRLVPQLPDPTLKGAAVAMERPSRVPVPGFETVKSSGALLFPVTTEPKDSAVGVTASCAVGRPVPVSPTTTGVNPALLDWIVTDPIRVPGTEGENVTVNVHIAPFPSCAPQLLPGRPKSPASW